MPPANPTAGHPRDWPLFEEIQAAKGRVAAASGYEEKLAALVEVVRLVRVRNDKIRREEAA